MINKIRKALLFSTVALIFVFVVNKIIVEAFFSQLDFFYSLERIYLFNVLITVISFLLLLFIYSKFPDKVGFAFIGFSIIKMAFSVVFLYPLIESNLDNKIPDVLTFFFCYFLLLLIESILVVSLLKQEN